MPLLVSFVLWDVDDRSIGLSNITIGISISPNALPVHQLMAQDSSYSNYTFEQLDNGLQKCTRVI
jgi:hypothetical protein